MKLPARTQESLVASADVPEGPRYPGGLSLHLDDDVLEKIGRASCRERVLCVV